MCTSTELSTVDVHRVVAELAKQNESLACLRLAKAWVVRGVFVGHTSLNSSVCQKLLAGRVDCFTPYDPRRRNGGFKQRQHEDCKRKTSTTHNIDDCDEKRTTTATHSLTETWGEGDERRVIITRGVCFGFSFKCFLIRGTSICSRCFFVLIILFLFFKPLRHVMSAKFSHHFAAP